MVKKKIQEEALENLIHSPILHPDHPVPTTRRQLLGQGFISMLAYVAMPSILSLIWEKTAYGLTCNAPADPAAAAIGGYLHFELSGGAALAGNFLFGKQRDGAPVEFLKVGSYKTLGLSDAQSPTTKAPNTEFGGPIHADSALLAGLKEVMSAEAIAKTVVVGVAGTSLDDVSVNELNPVQLALAASGNRGKLVQIAGTSGSNTGGRTKALAVGDDPSLSKVIINRPADIGALVDPGLIAAKLSKADAEKIAVAASRMSASKLAMFEEKDLPTQINELAQCGYIGTKDLLSEFDSTKLDPTQDTVITGMNKFNFSNADEGKVATIVKLLCDGNAAGGTIAKGGYDYHGQGRAAQDAKDREAGRNIGLALEYAHLRQRPLFIAVTSDGSVSSSGAGGANGRFDFNSDSGSRGAALIFAIGATARPQMLSHQIGAFNDSGAVDTSYLVTSNSPKFQALNLVANYAAFSGTTAKFEAALAAAGEANPFKDKDKQYLAFVKK